MALNSQDAHRAQMPAPKVALAHDIMLRDVQKLLSQNDLAHGLSRCLDAIKAYPQSATLWRLAGQTAGELQHMEVAIEAMRQAIRLSGTKGDWADLAQLYLQSGEPRAAARCYEAALEQHASATELFLPLARAWAIAGEDGQAVRYLKQHTRHHPDAAEAWRLMGDLNVRQGALEDALEAYETALRLAPKTAAVLSNMGLVYQRLGRLKEAVIATAKSADLQDDCAETFVNLGNQHFALEEISDAITAYDRAITLDPGLHAAQAQKLHLQARQCDWQAYREFARHADQIGIAGQPIAPFAALTLEDHPARQRQRAARHAAKWVSQPRNFPVRQGARPRIAYVSSDIYDHATLHLMLGVLEAHYTAAFDIFIYACNPPQDSPLTTRLSQTEVHLRYAHNLTDQELVAMARRDGIDIAVDLKGYTRGARTGVFYAGLAPIQVNYLGYPGTMEGAAMDYIIADPVLIPPDLRAHYSEAVVYLPDSYQPNDRGRTFPDVCETRSDHNLPDKAPVLCCFNESYKIGPTEFAIWMDVMRETPAAVLWLIDNGSEAAEALRATAGAAGVDPERLIFAPRLPHAEHMRRLPLADLFVDTFHYNAHTTASDALWMGVPVVTKTGQQFAARVATSLLNAMDMAELATTDDDSYKARITTLLSEPTALEALKTKLRDKRLTTPLFETKRYTEQLEAAYLEMIKQAQSGERRSDIHIT